jgi:hypothetical protein
LKHPWITKKGIKLWKELILWYYAISKGSTRKIGVIKDTVKLAYEKPG